MILLFAWQEALLCFLGGNWFVFLLLLEIYDCSFLCLRRVAWIPWARSTGVRCNNSSALKYQVDFTTSTKFKGPDCPGVRLKDLAAETRGGMGAAPLCVCVCLQRSQPSSEAGWDVHASVCVCIKRKGVGVRGDSQDKRARHRSRRTNWPPQTKEKSVTAQLTHTCALWWKSKARIGGGRAQAGRVGWGGLCVSCWHSRGASCNTNPPGASHLSREGYSYMCVCVYPIGHCP